MKHKYLVPLGCGLNPYAPMQHHVLDFIGGLIGGAFGLAGQAQQAAYTKEQQKLQSKLNREEMAYSAGLQRNQQEWSANTMYGKTVNGMKNAGLNPATANGTSPATPASVNPSSGGVGPSGPPTSSLGADIMSGVAAGKSIEQTDANIEFTKAQTKNIEQDTLWKQFMNSPEYQSATLKGVQNSALKDWWSAKNSEKGIELTDAEIAHKAALTKELGAKYDLDRAQERQVNALAAQTYAKILEIRQNMRESEFRIMYHRAAANAQNAAASLSHAQAKTEDALRSGRVSNLDASTSELRSRSGMQDAQQMLTNEKRATEVKNRKQVELDNTLKEYVVRCNQIYTPEDRAGLSWAKDCLGLMNPFQGIIAINSGN